MTTTDHGKDALAFAVPNDYLTTSAQLHWSAKQQVAASWSHAAYWTAVKRFSRGPTGRRRPPATVRVRLPMAHKISDTSIFAPTVTAIINGFVTAGVWNANNDEWIEVARPECYVTKDPQAPVIIHLTYDRGPRPSDD